MDVEELIAREAIRKTAARYHMTGDRGDAAGYASCFTEDGVLDSPDQVIEGRDAIQAWIGGGKIFDDGARAPSFIQHHLTLHAIELTGPETAEGRAYFSVFSDAGPDHCGLYTDEYRKVGEEWLISRRKVRARWLAPDGFAAAMAPDPAS